MINSSLYPIVERTEKGKQIVYRRVKHINLDYNEDVPYINDVKEFFKKNPVANKDRLLIVSSSESAAVKAARFICDKCDIRPLFEAEDQDIELDFEFDEEEFEDLSTIDLIDLNAVRVPDILPANAYLNSLLDEADGDIAMYEGLNNCEDIKNKIDAILADHRVKKYIWLLPERLKEPWAVALQMEKGFLPVILNEIPDTYYEEIFAKIMETAKLKLEKGLTVSAVVGRIRKLRGNDFTEDDLDWIIEHAMQGAASRGSKELKADDFVLDGMTGDSPEDKLMKMPGLGNVKDMVTEFTSLLRESVRNRKLKGMHSNMIFYGNPGTGKSTCAKLLADIMSEKGISNASFIAASRADIIGKYVGHTATKVSGLFDKARGGILFVDEAGFFLNEGSGGYVQEAVKEFVRFMELYPDVTVIFAMYEKEAAAFMKLDEGIASRISRMVAFEDYSDSELKAIFDHMIKEKGYIPAKGASGSALAYAEELRSGRNFGNAREIRKIAESAIVAHSVRIHSGIRPEKDTEDTITPLDVKKGIERLRRMPKIRKNFGFEYSRAAVMSLN